VAQQELTPPIWPAEEKKLRHARSNCIAAFGLFMVIPTLAVISLRSDMSNLDRLHMIGGVGVFLGGVVILYSLLYIPFNWRHLRRLAPITQAVGLIGLTGFVATVLLYFILLAIGGYGHLEPM